MCLSLIRILLVITALPRNDIKCWSKKGVLLTNTLLLQIFILTRHSMAVQIGSDDFLQLVIWGRFLKPQAEVVLQVLVELVTWKKGSRENLT